MAVRVLSTVGFRAVILSGILALTSCAGADEDTLVVATNLSEAETDRIENALPEPRASLRWVRVPESTDPSTVLDRGGGVDVLLGAPGESFRRLERQGWLQRFDDASSWFVYRSVPIGWTVSQRARVGSETGLITHENVTIDDPRLSPVTYAYLRDLLDDLGWEEGYRRILSAAAHPPLIATHAGESLAMLRRAEIPVAVTRSDQVPEGCDFNPSVPTLELEDGVGIVRGTRHLEAARRFLDALQLNGPARIPSDRREIPLLPELLGAALVEAQPELIEAMQGVRHAGLEEKAKAWLVPPPWPPASITRLKRSDPSGELVESLAEQMVPDFKSRVWLLESWKVTPRPIDAALLREIASAADGKLIAEPRFRAWLAVEWRTWARQCYRRVTREARRLGP